MLIRADILSITPIDIDLQEFTSSEYLSIIETKHINIADEITRNNIILKGIESFYSLVG